MDVDAYMDDGARSEKTERPQYYLEFRETAMGDWTDRELWWVVSREKRDV